MIFLFSFSLLLRVLPLNWTVGMAGILAGTIEDALIAYVLPLQVALLNHNNFFV